MISYAVSARTREIGIRVALGAHSANVRALIIRQGMLLTSVGLMIGLGGSLFLTPVLQSFLIDLLASDSATFAAVAVALVAIALVASYVPARCATRIDPIAARFAPSRSVVPSDRPLSLLEARRDTDRTVRRAARGIAVRGMTPSFAPSAHGM